MLQLIDRKSREFYSFLIRTSNKAIVFLFFLLIFSYSSKFIGVLVGEKLLNYISNPNIIYISQNYEINQNMINKKTIDYRVNISDYDKFKQSKSNRKLKYSLLFSDSIAELEKIGVSVQFGVFGKDYLTDLQKELSKFGFYELELLNLNRIIKISSGNGKYLYITKFTDSKLKYQKEIEIISDFISLNRFIV